MAFDLKHYVYALMDPRDETVFYIGKGQGSRVVAHEREALSQDKQNSKHQRIREIVSAGLDVRKIILAKDFDEANEALVVEALLLHQAKRLNSVLGLKCDLTNLVAGHHEDRFRPWSESRELPSFEYEPPHVQYMQTLEHVRPLFQYVIENVSVFNGSIKRDGMYIRSQKRSSGFEFVLYPKSGYRVYFEYIARSATEEQKQLAQAIRERLDLGGGYQLAKVDCPQPFLDVKDHVAVASALQLFAADVIQAEEAELAGK